jgi:hypothetical protein
MEVEADRVLEWHAVDGLGIVVPDGEIIECTRQKEKILILFLRLSLLFHDADAFFTERMQNVIDIVGAQVFGRERIADLFEGQFPFFASEGDDLL